MLQTPLSKLVSITNSINNINNKISALECKKYELQAEKFQIMQSLKAEIVNLIPADGIAAGEMAEDILALFTKVSDDEVK